MRTAIGSDKYRINRIYRFSFPEEERELVANLAVNLLLEETKPKTLSFVAETKNTIAAHIAFSPITTDDNSERQGYILAPLAVAPEHQKQGIGSQLVQHGIQQLTQAGIDILLVYGDPKYYSRFGFSKAIADHYIPPYKLEYPFGWQGLVLSDRPPAKSSVQINCVPALRDPAMW